MPTINQLVRKGRRLAHAKTKSPALKSCPQKRGVCLRVYTSTPKKPNSALRKVARVRLTNGMEVTCYTRLLEPAKCWPDCAALQSAQVSATATRLSVVLKVSTLDAVGVADRKQGRSKYGAKRPK